MGAVDPRGDAACGDELTRPQVRGDRALELVGGVAVPVGHDDLVAREQGGPTAVGALDLGVLADAADGGEHEVADLRDHAGDQTGGPVQSMWRVE